MTEDVKRIVDILHLQGCAFIAQKRCPNWYGCNMLAGDELPCSGEPGRCVISKAADLIEQLADREWDLFDLITSVYHGKGYYFRQEDGTIYSRDSGQCMTFDQAIDEFCGRLSND